MSEKAIEFSLLDRETFCVRLTRENDNLQQLLDSTRCVEKISNDCWKYALSDYNGLVHTLEANVRPSQISHLNSSVLKAFEHKIANTQNDTAIDMEYVLEKIEPSLARILKDYQKESIQFAISHKGKALLADDMGLGKTNQAIALLSYYKADRPCLIIVPSSIKLMWKDTIQLYLDKSKSLVQVIENGKTCLDESCDFFVISYDLLKNKEADLLNMNFKFVICDESHLLKSGETLKCKSAKKLTLKAKRVILITGTPALSRPCELYSQVDMIAPGLFFNYHSFGVRYCEGYLVQNMQRAYWDYKGCSNAVELRAILEEKILIRHEKRNHFDASIRKRRSKLVLDENLIDLDERDFKRARKEFVDGSDIKSDSNRRAIIDYFMATSRVKEKAVCEHAKRLLLSGKKCLIFAYHQNVLDALEQLMLDNGYGFIRIDGKVPHKKRHVLVKAFQEEEKYVCALLSLTAAGTGITLTKAKHVLFAELYWNPSQIVQAEDRSHRLGQTENVHVDYLFAKGTIDELLWNILNKKLNILQELALNNENFTRLATRINQQMN